MATATKSEITFEEGISASCACTTLRRATRAVTQLYDLVLAPTGLKSTQFIVLKAIQEAGEIAQHEFAVKYGVAVETLSRRFGALRKKGLLQVRTGDKHGERIYRVTEQGRCALEGAYPYWERAQARLKRMLGDDDWNLLLQLSDRVAEAALKAERLRAPNNIQSRAPVCLQMPENPSEIGEAGDFSAGMAS